MSERGIDLQTARPPLPGLPDHRDQAVVSLDDPLRLDAKLIEALQPAAQEPLEASRPWWLPASGLGAGSCHSMSGSNSSSTTDRSPRLSAEYPRFNVSTFASPTACSIPRSRPRSLQRSPSAAGAPALAATVTFTVRCGTRCYGASRRSTNEGTSRGGREADDARGPPQPVSSPSELASIASHYERRVAPPVLGGRQRGRGVSPAASMAAFQEPK